MLQGYTIKEKPCLNCGLPLMEFNQKLDCLICPVLIKKAKKALNEKKEAEKRKVEEELKHEREQKEKLDEQRQLIKEAAHHLFQERILAEKKVSTRMLTLVYQ